MAELPQLDRVQSLAQSTTAWFVDVWGVLHNGIAPYASAVEACMQFRAGGGRVVLVSNSPRLAAGVIRQLDHVGVSRDAYDDVVTSGDVSRLLISAWSGRPVVHIGPSRDAPIFDGLGTRLVSADSADGIVCTGLADDERETPDDYRDVLARLKQRDIPMICANPDLTVERGGRIIPCAGAIAAAYAALGAEVLYAGKPYLPIYDAAFACVARLAGGNVDKGRVLAIGDGVATDIEGAARAGIRSLFIASAKHFAAAENLGHEAAKFLSPASAHPVAVMRQLAW